MLSNRDPLFTVSPCVTTRGRRLTSELLHSPPTTHEYHRQHPGSVEVDTKLKTALRITYLTKKGIGPACCDYESRTGPAAWPRPGRTKPVTTASRWSAGAFCDTGPGSESERDTEPGSEPESQSQRLLSTRADPGAQHPVRRGEEQIRRGLGGALGQNKIIPRRQQRVQAGQREDMELL